MILHVRFRTIQRLQHFSRARSHSLICRCSRGNFFLNFRVRSIQILFIWPNDAHGAISRNSETRTFFSRALAFVNLTLLSGVLSILNFHTRSLPILFIWPIDATRAISHRSATLTFFACAFALINLP